MRGGKRQRKRQVVVLEESLCNALACFGLLWLALASNLPAGIVHQGLQLRMKIGDPTTMFAVWHPMVHVSSTDAGSSLP